ncbi:hypothetical protein [Brucella grignonensis]|uniref:Putative membrane protein n=1 Tax=Brucella grignonensis TaxID=94627 RepID=A0A256FS20_9HYPH|nr:hypothetical protein [Brucella grignonensis]OYR17506.1 putative membrane protein [Brucella grignonensis]
MIKSIIFNNAFPVALVGYYISLLLNFSQTERMTIDLRPRHQRIISLLVTLSPVGLAISAVLGIIVVIARLIQLPS